MRDVMGMMRQARELQAKIEAVQQEIAALRLVGSAGGGLVTATMSGKGELVAIKIDPSLLKPNEAEILEDLILAASADARRKADAASAEKMQSMAGLPPGMKLPF